jgi:hypothetical protein
MKEITVLKVAPMCKPEVVTLKNDLRSLQEAVSIGADYTGLIEVVGLDAKTCIICNEEGKLIGLEPNRRLGYDILCGVFYVVGQGRQGNFVSLPSAAMEKYKQFFARPEIIPAEEAEATMMTMFYAL